MPNRNDPCPCGSGLKYKKCHLAVEERSRPSAEPSPLHELDERLVKKIFRFAEDVVGLDLDETFDDWFDPDTPVQLAVPWIAYTLEIDGQSLASRFLERRRNELSPREVSWLEAQERSWMTVWEVAEVDPGRSLSLVDLLTGERRVVRETTASRTVRRLDALLARVVDCEGESLMVGMHPAALPPAETAAVVADFRHAFKIRKKRIAAADLRNFEMAATLLEFWDDEVELMMERARTLPMLQNTDGDPILLTTERFRFDAEHRAEILDRLAAIKGTERDDDLIAFLRSDKTVIGQVSVAVGRLTIETNSIKRADAMKKKVERALGSLIRWESRSHTDPRSEAARAAVRDTAPRQASEEELAIVRLMKEKHYATWVDEPLPALGGRTPREAMKTRKGREEVVLLLKQFEHDEARNPAAERFDIGTLYEALGIRRKTRS